MNSGRASLFHGNHLEQGRTDAVWLSARRFHRDRHMKGGVYNNQSKRQSALQVCRCSNNVTRLTALGLHQNQHIFNCAAIIGCSFRRLFSGLGCITRCRPCFWREYKAAMISVLCLLKHKLIYLFNL